MIYRVTVKTTNSVQPGSGATFWNRSVAYCGNDLEEARIHYLKERATDYGAGYGNRAKETEIEQFESEPEEIDSEEAEEVDAEE